MNILKKLGRFVSEPEYRFNISSYYGLLNRMPDRKFVEKQYFLKTHRKLNLDNPVTFNEKLQWLKLYYHKDIFTKMVDKLSVKDYLLPIIGEKHIVPTLGRWKSFCEIDFTVLPEQFVLKTNHGCGGMYICRNKKEFDIKKAEAILSEALRHNYYYSSREWPYKNVKPMILAEQYLQDGDTRNLNVYKVFNFSGEPFMIQSIQNDKTKEESIDYFDTSWKLLALRQNYPNSKEPLKRPITLEKILKLSAKCSKGFPFLRTDWYEVNGEVYFSEFTFYSDAGHELFHPDEWDRKLGDLIVLPQKVL